MSDLGNILIRYAAAEEAYAKRNYREAANLYRRCYITYQTGELPVYMKEVEETGKKALKKYKMILKRHLTVKERREFEREDEAFGGWEENFGY